MNETVESQGSVVIAEQRLLNLLWLNPNLFENQDYSRELFIHQECKDMSDALDYMTKQGTKLTIDAWWQESFKRNINIQRSTVSTIVEMNSTANDYIKDIVEELKFAKKKVDTIEHLDTARKLINTSSMLTPEVMDTLREEFEQAEEGILSKDTSVKQIHTLETWGNLWNEEHMQRRNGKLYHFGEAVLDELVVDGPAPGTGGIITAQSGMGKTAFVTKIANGCINAGVPCIMFSLEMGAVPSYDRLLTTRTGIPYRNIVNPDTPEDFDSYLEPLQEARSKLNGNKLFRFCEDASISLADLKKAIIKFQSDIGQQYCIVIVDLITMVKEFSTEGRSGLAQNIEIAINKMNALSKELGFHWIGTAQLNRKGEDSRVSDIEDIDMFRPTRAQVKNSGALVERCRYAISLFRKKYYIDQYFPEDEVAQAEPDIVEVQLLKQNNGVTKRMYELFDGPTFTLTPYDKPVEEGDDEDVIQD